MVGRQIEIPLVAVPLPQPECGLNGESLAKLADQPLSGVDLFAATARYEWTSLSTTAINLIAVAQEAALLLPIVVLTWLVRVEALARFAPELSGRDHAAQ